MFRVVIVEDEKPILDLMKVLIGRNSDYRIMGAFTNPLDALECMPELKPDVVFIDVEMPKMNGLELASRIQQLLHQPEIVFTTAYKSYALEAFEVNALDYILKPITPEAIKRVTERLVKRQGKTVTLDQKKKGLTIRCFGGFEVRDSEGKPIHFRTRRAEELFAYFLCNPGRYISKWKVTDLLWPDMQEERGSSNLYNTIYLLKKMLKEKGFGMEIRKMNDGYILEIGNEVYDALEYQKFRLEMVEGKQDIEQMERLCSLYQGPLLDGKPYLWKISLEEAYSKDYTTWTRMLLDNDCAFQNWHKAEQRLEKFLSLYPLHEGMNQQMIDIYAKLGNKEMIARLYEKFETAYRSDLGMVPSSEFKDRVAAYLV
ncbi:response regulator [Paenibacillus wynnii]|uniref:response regulator n=1 Tax=Paenibacillus wynnii TaxID=268407 RepID=UPI00278D3E0F|nr:response regulator [Paenibacillus wynnii]MDQ0191666.1 two-component SAPR family response regulator [Paenibacillus wynnii]